MNNEIDPRAQEMKRRLKMQLQQKKKIQDETATQVADKAVEKTKELQAKTKEVSKVAVSQAKQKFSELVTTIGEKKKAYDIAKSMKSEEEVQQEPKELVKDINPRTTGLFNRSTKILLGAFSLIALVIASYALVSSQTNKKEDIEIIFIDPVIEKPVQIIFIDPVIEKKKSKSQSKPKQSTAKEEQKPSPSPRPARQSTKEKTKKENWQDKANEELCKWAGC